MRKLMLAVIALLGFTLTASAQGAAKKPAKAKTEAAAKPASTATLKKDGTPDKRFKENKK